MKYAISAGHEFTAKAAEQVLQEGGNAIDAAIAAFIMTWVVEPCMSSAGGGGFAHIYTSERKAYLLDFFCQTPGQKSLKTPDFFPIEVNFGDTIEHFHIGAASVAVPGSVAGVFALYKQFGSLPIRLLFEPAIEAAKSGVAINGFQHLDFSLLAPILHHQEAGRQLFFEDGKLKSQGSIITMPQMADYLDYLCREGEAAFYLGEIAQKIARQQAYFGGYLQQSDLTNYKVRWQSPRVIPLAGHQVLCSPAPHPGGNILASALKIMEEHISPEGPNSLHPPQLANTLIDLKDQLSKQPGVNKHGSTTHFSIVDQKGNAVSLTASNGEGSGYFIPGTDIQLNNMLGEAALLPEGFHNWPNNTRLGSMMTPSIVIDKEGLLQLVTGSSGAGRIPYAIAQVIYHNQVRGIDLHKAVNGPRMHLSGNTLEIEPGFEVNEFSLPAPYIVNQWSAQNLFFGGAHSVAIKNGQLIAAPDLRRDGVIKPG